MQGAAHEAAELELPHVQPQELSIGSCTRAIDHFSLEQPTRVLPNQKAAFCLRQSGRLNVRHQSYHTSARHVNTLMPHATPRTRL